MQTQHVQPRRQSDGPPRTADLRQDPSASAGGCNRSVGSFVWLTDALIFYAAHRTVVVYDVERRQSLATILGHQSVVTCVDGILASDDGHQGGALRFFLVSGAADGAVMAWDVLVAVGKCWEDDGRGSKVEAGVGVEVRRLRMVGADGGSDGDGDDDHGDGDDDDGGASLSLETTGPVTGVSCHAHGYGSRKEHVVAVSSGDGGGAVRVLGISAGGVRVLAKVQVGILVQCVRLAGFKAGGDARDEDCSTLVLAGGFVDGSVRLWGMRVEEKDGDEDDEDDEDDEGVEGVEGVDRRLRVVLEVASRDSCCVLRHQHQNWCVVFDI